MAAEEGEQKRADVGAVDIGIGHDDDLVVAHLFDVERAFLFAIADARADGGDHRLDFLVLQRAVEAGFLDIDQFSAQRKDCLRAAVAALFGRAACGVALDNVEFGFCRIALRAIGEFAGKATAGEGGFANRFAGFACGFAGARGIDGFFDDLAGKGRVLVEVLHQALIDDRGNHAFDLGVDEFVLRLRAEARVGHFHRDHADEAFADIVAGERGVLVLEDFVGLGVLVDGACERGAEACEVGATVAVGDRVGEAEDLVVVRIVVLEDHIGKNIVGRLLAVVVEFDLAFAAKDDWVVVNDGFVFAELDDEFLDAFGIEKRGFFCGLRAFVFEVDREAGVEEGEFAQAGGKAVEFEFDRIDEDRRVGEEGDRGAGFFRVDFADDVKLLCGFAAFETDAVDLAVAHDVGTEPVRESVDAFRADAVEAAGVLVGALAELAAGVEVGEHELDGGDAELRVHVDRNAAAVVRN